jgi:hypothetical protein
MNRGISWKAEAMRLARKFYPTVDAFSKFLRDLVRRNPKTPGNPFVKLTVVKNKERE